jgi:hypothetical protein
MAPRQDSFCEWREESDGGAVQGRCGRVDEVLARAAVNEQKKELSEYKKKAEAQAQIQIEPVPLTIELIKQDQGQEDRLEPIEA